MCVCVCVCVYFRTSSSVGVNRLHSFLYSAFQESTDILLPFEGGETGLTNKEGELLTEMYNLKN